MNIEKDFHSLIKKITGNLSGQISIGSVVAYLVEELNPGPTANK